MTTLRLIAVPVFYGGVCLALSGCVSSASLDPYLDKAVGKNVSEIRYPQLTYQKPLHAEEATTIIEYSIDSLWRCRWIFEVDKESGIVKTWRYPDSDAAELCRKLPASMP